MSAPTFTETEEQTHSTFLTMMWALSHPGRLFELGPGTGSVYNMTLAAQTLLDLETSFYTPDIELAEALSRTTAVSATPDKAFYHFYPSVVKTDLEMIAEARVGEMMYPDRGATLVLGCRLGTGDKYTFSGPGIQGETAVKIAFLPPEFWELREQKIQYPLGWDVFLIDGNRVIGIPRTTKVRQAEPMITT